MTPMICISLTIREELSTAIDDKRVRVFHSAFVENELRKVLSMSTSKGTITLGIRQGLFQGFTERGPR